MRPIELAQGADEVVDVLSNIDLTTATEIDFRIDTQPQLVKTLTGGGIGSVTATQFTVTIDAADLATVPAGPYKYQVQATIAGLVKQGLFQPDKIKVTDSIFTDEGMGNDYS
jgi:hypothetical protein